MTQSPTTFAPIPARTARFRLTQRTRRIAILICLLLLPSVALRLFTAVYPFFNTIWLSFHDWNPAFPPQQFAGLKNFQALMRDIAVTSSISFTVLFVTISTLLEIVLGMAIALILHRAFFGRGVVRAINLIPWAIPMVVAAIGFRWMYDTQYGVINDLLYRTIGVKVPWLVDFWGARAAVIATNVWKSTPFVGLVLLAALQGVPQDLYEAGRVDGTNRVSAFFYITLPLIMPQIVTIGLFMVVWQLAAFDLVFAMTGGGPGFATQLLAYRIYQVAFTALNFGYASAISMVLFIVVGIASIIGLLLFRKVEVSL
ncbi:MAG: sugar ABC transporter permease [Candidatus Roseilinea sp.]|nr:MAG: sugar ABC transporter permease [Candidatus Roseilinea sp.]